MAIAAPMVAAVSIGAAHATSVPDSSADVDVALTVLHDEAVAAGQTAVTIYGPSGPALRPVYDAFEERFPGITVIADGQRPAEIGALVDQEFATGNHVGDLIHLDDAPRWAEEGRLDPLTPVQADDLPDSVSYLDGLLWNVTYEAYGFMYNTTLVDPDELPAGWADVLDENWRGRIGLSDPTQLGVVTTVLTAALDNGAIDEQWIADFRELDPTIYANTSALQTAIATGESDLTVMMPYQFFAQVRSQGAPVGFIFPLEGGQFVSPFPFGLLQDAPSPLAARLLVSWLLSDEGQEAVVGVSSYAAVTGQGPEDLPPLDEALATAFELPYPDGWIEMKESGAAQLTELFG